MKNWGFDMDIWDLASKKEEHATGRMEGHVWSPWGLAMDSHNQKTSSVEKQLSWQFRYGSTNT
jgi:hypothetical protein